MTPGSAIYASPVEITAERYGLDADRLCELFDLTPDELVAAAAKLADFERFTSRVPTLQGDLFELDPFQRFILLPYFAGYSEVLALMPKGQGKTTLLALLQVYHLLTTPLPEVVVGASVRDQAGKIYREACRIAALPTLRNDGEPAPWRVPDGEGGVREILLRTLPGYREIRLGRRPEDGNLLVLASDKYDTGSLEGLGPTLGVCEELHAHKSDAIYAAIQGGLHKRPGQLFGISTAGKHLDSLLGNIRANFRRDGVITRVPELGKLTVFRISRVAILFEWALEESDDVEDMAVVKQANPASFVTLEGLARLRQSPGMSLSRWKRNHCGLWTAEAEGWLDGREAWDNNRVDEVRLEPGDEIYLGVDPAWAYDTFSIVGLKVTGERRAYVQPLAILRPTKGKTITHGQVKAALLEQLKTYRVLGMGYDRNRGFQHIIEELIDEHGLNAVAISMRGETWVPLTVELEAAIDHGYWTHPGDERYTSHVLSGEKKATSAGERLHGRTERKVDALMATGIAWVTAFGVADEDEIYKGRDLITSADDDVDDAELDAFDDEIDRLEARRDELLERHYRGDQDDEDGDWEDDHDD